MLNSMISGVNQIVYPKFSHFIRISANLDVQIREGSNSQGEKT